MDGHISIYCDLSRNFKPHAGLKRFLSVYTTIYYNRMQNLQLNRNWVASNG